MTALTADLRSQLLVERVASALLQYAPGLPRDLCRRAAFEMLSGPGAPLEGQEEEDFTNYFGGDVNGWIG